MANKIISINATNINYDRYSVSEITSFSKVYSIKKQYLNEQQTLFSTCSLRYPAKSLLLPY